jgi:hydroxypyruvate reductase/glycerate 2-kinase
MNEAFRRRREDALAIWSAGVAAVQPSSCIARFFNRWSDHGLPGLSAFDRIRVVGGGKAGAAMTLAVEAELERRGIAANRVSGIVNIPAPLEPIPTRSVRLHSARPPGTNQPTEAAFQGTLDILREVEQAGANDLLLCLISGGGSALLPAPVEGVSLADKQKLTALMHRSGANIQEMNLVRKHLSRIKGGGLVRCFHGRRIISIIISDVLGDPLDVIASGPTSVDPTTFQDALAVLEKYDLLDQAPAATLAYLRAGVDHPERETLKQLPVDRVHNIVIANNQQALQAAAGTARERGYEVVSLGSFIEGETAAAASVLAGIARGMAENRSGKRFALLSGGETTVKLPADHGKGGRNQEFVLAAALAMDPTVLADMLILSGGTDGEDGPTDAAGAWADTPLLESALALQLSLKNHLARHDAYPFFERIGSLIKTGLTQTNVADLRVMLVN